jgi:L-amino acid N-acyltransferase YncA
MNASIRAVSANDWEPITAIFNHFVTDSFAAYPDQPVDESFFRDRHNSNPTYPFVVVEIEGVVVGFAYLSPFHSASTIRRTAILTYFLHPEQTGRGIGTEVLEHLLQAGNSLGLTNFLAHVSSLNPGSVRFHLKHGFTECGRFLDVGEKDGHLFDMVWLQKRQR